IMFNKTSSPEDFPDVLIEGGEFG
ncbi:hypothetical protein LCGC14_3168650, partial [marine sediment metagenome]